MTIKPAQSGHADVNGFRLYHEVYGAGERLVLPHGGLKTIPERGPLVQALADRRHAIAIELQGHGRRADTDRPLRDDGRRRRRADRASRSREDGRRRLFAGRRRGLARGDPASGARALPGRASTPYARFGCIPKSWKECRRSTRR